MVAKKDKNFKLQIVRKTVNSILKDIFQHRQIRYNELKTKNPELKKEEIEVILKKEHFYFRGESSYYELRTPSLYLQKNLAVDGSEYYYRVLLNELGRDDYQENTTLVRLISELQHYGAKTRMLDITRSPLIALYFAVEKDDDEPGFIFIYKSDSESEKFDTGHTVAIKSALNFIPQNIINKFLDTMESIETSLGDKADKLEYISVDNAKEKLLELNYPGDEIDSNLEDIERFMEFLNQRSRVRERLIFPFKIYRDLQKSHIVIPSKTTDRIRQQQGAFIYPKFVSSSNKDISDIKKEISESITGFSAELVTDKNSPDKSLDLEKVEKLTFSVIKIDAGNKKAIRDQLELLGITEGFVYPDIEHQSKALLEQLNPIGKN